MKHGTRSRYVSGCPCDACREANTAYQRTLKGKPPPRHGASGYVNFGCRCQVCRDGNLVRQRIRGSGYARQWRERVRGNPPQHGTVNGYTSYSCRCDLCRAAVSAAGRERRARKLNQKEDVPS